MITNIAAKHGHRFCYGVDNSENLLLQMQSTRPPRISAGQNLVLSFRRETVRQLLSKLINNRRGILSAYEMRLPVEQKPLPAWQSGTSLFN